MPEPFHGRFVRIDASEIDVPAEASDVVRLQRQMLDATYRQPGEFASDLVHLLREELGLVAASFYLNCPELDAFKLKAAAGLDYEKYESFLLTNPSYVSVACDSKDTAVLCDEPPFDERLYRDRGLLAGRNVGGIIVVPIKPIGESASAYPSPLGALCMYPARSEDVPRLAAIGANLSQLIGTLYIAALERLLMRLREEAVEKVAFNNSLTDVSHKLLALMKQHLMFDAGAVWLLNPRRELLYLRSATPGVRTVGRRIIDHEIQLDELDNPLAIAFAQSTTVHHANPGQHRDPRRRYVEFAPARILEVLPSGFQNGVIAPLVPSEPVSLGNQKRSALGVLTILNKYSELGGVRHYAPFTWEDEALISFMSRLAAVLVFQALRSVDHEADYERRIHGVKTNVTSVKAHLEQLEDHEQISSRVSDRHQYHLSNCIEWLAEMEQQVSRADRIERLTVAPRRIRVYAAVLTKAFQLARRAARANDVAGFELLDVDVLANDAHSIPPVFADSRALLTVYRNLFENTFKYRDRDLDHCTVRIWHDETLPSERGYVRLHYEDNGIGIAPSDRSKVFDEGYRSRRARRVHVQGQGIGLSECRVLLEAMGGSISCADPISGSGAHFLIRLRSIETPPPRPSRS